MILKKFFLLPLIFSLISFVYADDLSDWDKAINLVNEEYGAEYLKRLKGTGANPSYMANSIDQCNYWVKVGTHQPETWSVMDHFNVNICEETVKLKDLRVRR